MKIGPITLLGPAKILKLGGPIPCLSGAANACGEYQFNLLPNFALKMILLPICNAVVERVFSIMNATKTKVRNRMSQHMLIALIRIKIHYQVKKLLYFIYSNIEHDYRI